MKTIGLALLFSAFILLLLHLRLAREGFSSENENEEDIEMSQAVALFTGPKVNGEVLFIQRKNGVVVSCTFTKLPPGQHGFHIHKGGDLRGEGCKLACDHWHKGRATTHGGPPSYEGPRHTGDLGNLDMQEMSELKLEHFLRDVRIDELYGRSVIVHADKDDLGQGPFEDSKTTGHSGARIACAIIGRVVPSCSPSAQQTRKNSKKN